LVLLDWTRMTRSYCLAGAVPEHGQYRVVRPLLAKNRQAAVRNAGWSAWLLDGHRRWELFELIGPQVASPEPPHCEDLWVRSLRPAHRLAPPEERRAILAATVPPPGEPLFGAELTLTQAAAYLPPGSGCRSLVTVVVPARHIQFRVVQREGAQGPDVRVRLPLPGWEGRLLPVKDHHLLGRVEQATGDPHQRGPWLEALVGRMGEQVAVRLGLSRPFAARPGGPGYCWLMADGFFSLTDPQP
jgi:hypothetical protein